MIKSLLVKHSLDILFLVIKREKLYCFKSEVKKSSDGGFLKCSTLRGNREWGKYSNSIFYAFLNLRSWIMFSFSLFFSLHIETRLLLNILCFSQNFFISFFYIYFSTINALKGFCFLGLSECFSFRIKTRLGVNYQSNDSNSLIKYQIFPLCD